MSAGKKITLLQLIAATYFMVAGGPYGLEEMVKSAGYLAGLACLLIVPVIWSLPTAFMVSELSSALPEEGGYYRWVRRAMGPFWGFQEAWLSLAASVFDMALYPTLFVTYLSYLEPDLKDSLLGWYVKVGLVAVCVLMNIGGVRWVGGSSLLMTLALLGPFVVLVAMAFGQTASPVKKPEDVDFMAGLLFAMWNYMGWDNASTIAGEVDRPRRTYPLAMIAAAVLVTVTYFLPIWAASRSGIEPEKWETGAWVDVARQVGGDALGMAVIVGGMICGFGMLNALVMSYSRVPVVLAADGFLPKIFTRCHPRTGAPWVSISACALAWAAALTLTFDRLLVLDVMIYGLSLILEFVALIFLRIKEPGLARPFRVPGGLWGAVLIAVGPTLLIGFGIYHERDKMAGAINAVLLAAIVTAVGPAVYCVRQWVRPIVD
jgi:amino acid transporter